MTAYAVCAHCGSSAADQHETASLRAQNQRLSAELLAKLDAIGAVRRLCEERRDVAARNSASYYYSGTVWLAAEVLALLDGAKP